MKEELVNGQFVSEEKRKEEMLARFNAAYTVAGKRWRDLVISQRPEYDSKNGADVFNRIIGDRARGTRIAYFWLKEVTEALERAVGINPGEK